jgi:prepilin-type N-terminal cleavage/methylation domain-containing protein
MHKKKAFTLIELLVVISIISLLSSIVMTSVNQGRLKARDTRRVSDLVQLKAALELYFDSYQTFPLQSPNTPPVFENSRGGIYPYYICANSSPSNVWPPGGAVSKLVPTYIQKIPTDPMNDSSHCYVYAINSNGLGGCVWNMLERSTNNKVGVIFGQPDTTSYPTGFPVGYACSTVNLDEIIQGGGQTGVSTPTNPGSGSGSGSDPSGSNPSGSSPTPSGSDPSGSQPSGSSPSGSSPTPSGSDPSGSQPSGSSPSGSGV